MVIYKTTCPDGLIYIGQSHNNELDYFGSGSKIINYINKHGVHGLKKEILHHCNSQEELDEMETFYIKKYNATNRNIGLNILPGSSNKFGCGSPMLLEEVRQKVSNTKKEWYKTHDHHTKGKKKSKEHIEKIRIGKIGFKHTEESKIKMSNSRKGGVSSMKGKKHSEESKIKISISGKGRKHSNESLLKISISNKGKIKSKEHRLKISNTLKSKKNIALNRKSVLQFDLQGNFIAEFESITCAAKFLNIERSYISAVCNNLQKTACGFIFKLKRDDNK